jgi:hypothetical protein
MSSSFQAEVLPTRLINTGEVIKIEREKENLEEHLPKRRPVP